MSLLLMRSAPRNFTLYVLLTLVGFFTIALLYHSQLQQQPCDRQPMVQSASSEMVNRDTPIIFVGGVPRSGTTLMRTMLDAHPDVRCGEETRLIPRILGMRKQWKASEKEAQRLRAAGITDDVIDSAIGSFIIEIIARHGPPANRLCNKDPFNLKSMDYLAGLFPKSKFILMIRDGRAVVHSIMSRRVTITGFDLNDAKQCLKKWNQAITTMYHLCYLVGEQRCFPMYYEQLVLHPREQMQQVLNFLELGWNESVLHHEKLIGAKISLSQAERSTDQVMKAINLEALNKWVGKFSKDVVDEMSSIAPMLAHLGYDPNANPPNYGAASEAEASQLRHLNDNVPKQPS